MTDARELFDTHRDTLDQAVEATRTREYFSAYPESPSPRVYGETAAADGQAAFDAVRKSEFSVVSPGAEGVVATEESPFGLPLDIAYPRMTAAGLDELLAAAEAGKSVWRDCGIEARVGIGLEVLARL